VKRCLLTATPFRIARAVLYSSVRRFRVLEQCSLTLTPFNYFGAVTSFTITPVQQLREQRSIPRSPFRFRLQFSTTVSVAEGLSSWHGNDAPGDYDDPAGAAVLWNSIESEQRQQGRAAAIAAASVHASGAHCMCCGTGRGNASVCECCGEWGARNGVSCTRVYRDAWCWVCLSGRMLIDNSSCVSSGLREGSADWRGRGRSERVKASRRAATHAAPKKETTCNET
jgi:hypothetical protein